VFKNSIRGVRLIDGLQMVGIEMKRLIVRAARQCARQRGRRSAGDTHAEIEAYLQTLML
jgi:hypothetical protein